jgi:hypothetical protein
MNDPSFMALENQLATEKTGLEELERELKKYTDNQKQLTEITDTLGTNQEDRYNNWEQRSKRILQILT